MKKLIFIFLLSGFSLYAFSSDKGGNAPGWSEELYTAMLNYDSQNCPGPDVNMNNVCQELREILYSTNGESIEQQLFNMCCPKG